MADVLASLAVKIFGDTSAFEAALAKTQGKLSAFGKSMNADIGKAFDQFDKDAARLEKGIGRLGETAAGVGKNLSTYFTLPIAAFGALTTKVAGDFEAGMKRVAAATGATGPTFDALNEKAKQLGATTQFSATEAAAGLETLAKNGLSAGQILDGAIDASLNLAAATGGNLATAADIATDVMANFGKEAKDLAGLVDGITGVTIASKFSIDDYRLALGQAGGVAGALGVSIEDFNTAIAATSSAFASGSDAGTAFKTFLQRLNPQSKEAAAIMQELGLNFFDASGKMKPLNQIAGELQNAFKNLSDEQKNQAASTIFGSDALRTALLLAKQGATGFDNMAASIAKVSAAEQAQTRMEGFNGAVKSLSSAFEALQIAIMDSGLLSGFTSIVNGATDILRSLAELNPTVLRTVAIIAGIAAAIGPVLYVLGSLTGVVLTMKVGLGVLSTAFLAATGGATGFAGALALITGPIGLIVAAIIAATVIIIRNWDSIVAYFTTGPGAEVFQGLKDTVVTVFDEIKSVIGGAVKIIAAVFNRLAPVLSAVFSNAFRQLGTILSAALGVIRGIVKVFGGILTLDFAKIWDGVKTIFVSALNGLIGLVANLITGTIGLFKGFLESLGIGEGLQKVLTKASEGVDNFANKIKLGSDSAAKSVENIGQEAKDTGKLLSTGFDEAAKSITRYGSEVAALNSQLKEQQRIASSSTDANIREAAEKNIASLEKQIETVQRLNEEIAAQKKIVDTSKDTSSVNAAKDRLSQLEKEHDQLVSNEAALRKLNTELGKQKSILASTDTPDANVKDATRRVEEIEKQIRAIQGQEGAVKSLNIELLRQQDILSSAATDGDKAAARSRIDSIHAQILATEKLSEQIDKQKQILSSSSDDAVKTAAKNRIEALEKEMAVMSRSAETVRKLNEELSRQQQTVSSSKDASEVKAASDRIKILREQISATEENSQAISKLNTQLLEQKNILSSAGSDETKVAAANRIASIQAEIASLESLGSTALKQVPLLKDLEAAKEKALARKDNATTEAEVKAANIEIASIQARIDKLNDLGVASKASADEQSKALKKYQQASKALEDSRTLSDTTRQAAQERIATIEKEITALTANEQAVKKLNQQIERQKQIASAGEQAEIKIVDASARIAQIQKEIAAINLNREAIARLNEELSRQKQIFDQSQNDAERSAAAIRVRVLTEELSALTKNEAAVKSLNAELSRQNKILQEATLQSDAAKNASIRIESIQKEIAAITSNGEAVRLLNIELERQREILSSLPAQDVRVASVQSRISELQAQISLVEQNEQSLKRLNTELERQNILLSQASDDGGAAAIRERISAIQSEITALSGNQQAVTKLNEELTRQKAILESNTFDYTRERVELLQKSLEDLLTKGFAPGSKVIQDIQEELNKLNGQLALSQNLLGSAAQVESNVERKTKAGPVETIDITNIDTSSLLSAQIELDKTKLKLQEAGQAAIEQESILNNAFSSINGAIQDAAVGIAIGIGEMIGSLASGGDAFKSFPKTILIGLLDMAATVGKIAISTGVALSGIMVALKSLNPAVAIAGGIALVALAGVAKGALTKAAGGVGGGTGGANVSPRVEQPLSRTAETNVKVTGELVGQGSALKAVVKESDRRERRTTG